MKRRIWLGIMLHAVSFRPSLHLCSGRRFANRSNDLSAIVHGVLMRCVLSCALVGLLSLATCAASLADTEANVVSASANTSDSWSGVAPSPASQLVSLDLSLKQLNEAGDKDKLLSWVRGGGVVVLRTDAAQAFGFKTVAPRQTTKELAGQMFGRGEAALPFGASPLLMSATSQSLDGNTLGVLGVRTVFYHLRPADQKSDFAGECLLSDVGGGWPLLRVCDVTAQDKPLYASALLAFGRGFALFVPQNIENRSDGAQFKHNLSNFIAQVQAGKWLTLPIAPVREAFEQGAGKSEMEMTPLIQAATQALDEPKDEDGAPATEDGEAPLLLRREELQTLQTLWQNANKSDEDEARAKGVVLELAARSAMTQTQEGGPVPAQSVQVKQLLSSDPQGRQGLFSTQEGGPHAATTRWWCGVFALCATIAPLSTQPPGSLWPEPVAFSFAQPALEAAKWWSGGGGGTETSAPSSLVAGVAELTPAQITKCVVAVQKMAKTHKDDPPLLMAWQTGSGAKWKLLLTPMEAASDRFPALTKDWGVPSSVENAPTGTDGLVLSHFSLRAPGARYAMDPASPYATITYSPCDRMRWKMLRLLSGSLSGWCDSQNTTWATFPVTPYLTLGPVIGIEGSQRVVAERADYKCDNLLQPYIQGSALIFPGYYHDPIPTEDAYLHMASLNGRRINPDDVNQKLNTLLYVHWMGIFRTQTKTFPPRFARILCSLQARSLTDQAPAPSPAKEGKPVVPSWMEQGLQNIASLYTGDMMADQTQRDKWYPTPPEAVPAHEEEVRQSLQESQGGGPAPQDNMRLPLEQGITSARTRSLIALPVDEPVSEKNLADDAPADDAYTGLPLEEEDATKQMRFFLDRFGVGPLTETIQRLGAGQSIDEALQATINMNQSQFFDLCRERNAEDTAR